MLRRTEWFPVDGDPAMEQTKRGCESESDDELDEQDAEMEALYESSVESDYDAGRDQDSDHEADVEFNACACCGDVSDGDSDDYEPADCDFLLDAAGGDFCS